ncbi:hypothetical protein DIPPA_01340 [Diplonema papillatum]|nr:hypothetical protein DIPPA_01340 [Diplonema papillatum]KAJ9445497.1 hypothetical protein DIPPA_01340 [Diplonema papillatum]KAJ9445498.1 hypothetical protein DIPPA_01340 [Diplonema papillatum]
MSSIEPKSVLDSRNESLEGPDGYVYNGLPNNIRGGLFELWDSSTAGERRAELADWDMKVRLAIKLGQIAVPNPPLPQSEREARMNKRPVATRSGTGWGADSKPVGYRAEPTPVFSGWAATAPTMRPAPRREEPVPGAAPVSRRAKMMLDNGDVPGAEPVKAPKPAKKKEDKPKDAAEKDGPKEAKRDDKAKGDKGEAPKGKQKEDKTKDANGAAEADDFPKKSYPDTAKALRNLNKTLKQTLQLIEDGPKNDAQKEKIARLPTLKDEIAYLQGLVDKGVASQ